MLCALKFKKVMLYLKCTSHFKCNEGHALLYGCSCDTSGEFKYGHFKDAYTIYMNG